MNDDGCELDTYRWADGAADYWTGACSCGWESGEHDTEYQVECEWSDH